MTQEQIRVCLGCGIPFQTEDQHRPGYIPASALNKEDIICRRCFRIKHYNEVAEVDLNDDDFRRILHKIGSADGLVVNIVDLVDFNGSFIPGLNRFVGNKPVLLVGNKLDILPKAINLSRMKHWMRERASEWGLKPVDVVLISGLKGKNIDELVAKIDEYRKGKDVYIVGTTNVGKSTVINRLLKDYGEGDEGNHLEITTSRFPGTTLDMIEIPLDDHSALFDTPGVINRDQILHMISAEELKIVLPTTPINPKVYQLKEGQTLFFGGLVRFDFIAGKSQSFVAYLSNRIPIHRTKLEKADQLYQDHIGALLSPPGPETLAKMPPLQRHFFSIPAGEKKDIAISGLGWVTLQGVGAKVEVYAPKGVSVQIRKSLI